MVDSRFLTSDNATQNGVNFLKILAEKAITDVQTVTPMLFLEMLWKHHPLT
jgi:hypothetical protein